MKSPSPLAGRFLHGARPDIYFNSDSGFCQAPHHQPTATTAHGYGKGLGQDREEGGQGGSIPTGGFRGTQGGSA